MSMYEYMKEFLFMITRLSQIEIFVWNFKYRTNIFH